MAEKFSQFNVENTLGNITGLVGYIAGTPGTNVKISPTDLSAGITTPALPDVLTAGSVANSLQTITLGDTGPGGAYTAVMGASGITINNTGPFEITSNGELKMTHTGGGSGDKLIISTATGAGSDAGILIENGGISGNAYLTLKTATNLRVDLPVAPSAAGDILQATNTDGDLEWVTPSGGGGGLTPTTQTTNYTAAASDFVICNVTTSLRVTLPAASAGATVGIKYASQNAPTDFCDILTPSVGVTIDGTDRSTIALVLPSLNTYYELISDGTNWFIK